ncbi:MAG TPA: hypothetical protein VGK31_12090 [Thermoanaerobaculia bacterium]
MRCLTVMLLALAILACQSEASKAEKARNELASWAAAGAKLSREWSRGTVRKPYVKTTVKVALASLQQLADPLKSDQRASGQRSTVTSLFEEFSQRVERDDRSHDPRFAAISEELQRATKR